MSDRIAKYQKFLALHQGSQPFLLGNAWDATSARLFEEAGFAAVATSSSAIARSLGSADGQQISFAEMVRVCAAIGKTVSVPFSVDMEAGYGDTPAEVCENLEQLLDVGAVGINIEDSLPFAGKRTLMSAERMVGLIRGIRTFLAEREEPLFINARADSYLMGRPDPREEALSRAYLYRDAGADGLFVPRVQTPEDIRTLVSVGLPLNVLVGPGVPDLPELATLGVRRVSMGGDMQTWMVKQARDLAVRIRETNSFSGLLQ
ncbi:MAG: isocitrate lyase/phosphoenolpyruvate mutase family protein [Leptospiraceae bacterium]|nr:isocitrate lyase/phosphoenolpyruvate mutase family protein [Leptospiraceae bacterium]